MAQLEGGEGRVDLVAAGLLGAKAATHARLGDAHAALRNLQGGGHLAADVERHLRRGDHAHAVLGVGVGVAGERLHHRLLGRLGLVVVLDDDVGGGEGRIKVAHLGHLVADEVAREVLAHGDVGADIVLVVHHHGVVERLGKVGHRGQDLIVDLDEALGRGDGALVGAHHDGHLVADVAHGAVEDEGVVGAHLAEGLAREGEALVGHVLVGVDGHDAVDALGLVRVDRADAGVGVGRAQQAHDVGVAWGKVVGVDGAALEQASGVLLDHGVRDARELAGALVGGDEVRDGAHARTSSALSSAAMRAASLSPGAGTEATEAWATPPSATVARPRKRRTARIWLE